MAHPSFSLPDELLDEFDDTILRLKVEGEIDRDASRSEVVRMLIEDFVEEHREDVEGNATRAVAAPAN